MPVSIVFSRIRTLYRVYIAYIAAPEYCSLFVDIQPHHLLQHLVPSLDNIPAGIQIEFDEHSNKHAFTFTHHASGLGFSTKTIYVHCDFFSEELSLLVSFKTLPTSTNEETLFAVKSPVDDAMTFGVTLHNGLELIRIRYSDGYSKTTQTADFRDEALFDGEWHSVVIVYNRDRIALLVDCSEQHFSQISRTFPTHVNIADHRFYIGNDGRRKRGIFSVSSLGTHLPLLP